MDDKYMGISWVVVVLMRKNRHNVWFGTVLMEVLGQRAAPCTVELMAEQEDSAPTKANLEKCGHDRFNGKNLTTYGRERPGSGFC